MRNKELWFDLFILACLWVLVLIVPPEIELIQGTSIVNLLKIVALFSSLETLGYLGTHLVGASKGLLLQGLCGGFISSTMTYLRMTRNSQLAAHAPHVIAQALLLSTIAMLFECGFIIYTLHPHAELLVAPILAQIVVLAAITLWFQRYTSQEGTASSLHIEANKDPIIWKKMIYLSLFIILLTYAMRFIEHTLKLPYVWSAFFISLFEAHGVLVATMTDSQQSADISRATQVVMVILVGNVVSKTFFVLKSNRKDIRTVTLAPLYLSLIIALVLGFSRITL